MITSRGVMARGAAPTIGGVGTPRSRVLATASRRAQGAVAFDARGPAPPLGSGLLSDVSPRGHISISSPTSMEPPESRIGQLAALARASSIESAVITV